MKDGTNLKEQLEREGGVFLENIQDSFVDSLTHLIIFDEHGENLYKILKLPLEATKHIHIVTEHWVEDSLKLKNRIAETSYIVPINESERQKVQDNPLGIAIIPPHFFIGHSFYFHQYEDLLNAKTSLLDLHWKVSKSTDTALCNPIISLIHRAGGKVYNSFEEIPSNEPCFIIAPYKDTTLNENIQKLLFGAKLRTIFWLADAVRAANLNLEPTHILHFPRPSHPKTLIENMVMFFNSTFFTCHIYLKNSI